MSVFLLPHFRNPGADHWATIFGRCYLRTQYHSSSEEDIVMATGGKMRNEQSLQKERFCKDRRWDILFYTPHISEERFKGLPPWLWISKTLVSLLPLIKPPNLPCMLLMRLRRHLGAFLLFSFCEVFGSGTASLYKICKNKTIFTILARFSQLLPRTVT